MKNARETELVYDGPRIELTRRAGASYYGGSMAGTCWSSPRIEVRVKGFLHAYQSPVPQDVRRAMEVEGRFSAKKRAEVIALAKDVEANFERYAQEKREREEAEAAREDRAREERDRQYKLNEAAPAMRDLLGRALAALEAAPERNAELAKDITDVLEKLA